MTPVIATGDFCYKNICLCFHSLLYLYCNNQLDKIMEKVTTVASYIYQRYQKDYGKCMDEMKLHKLLYFVQREAIIQMNEPMFKERFEAWRYGPVMVEIRRMYKEKDFTEKLSEESIEKYKSVFDMVFATYVQKDSWSLSCITHGEYSWGVARNGVPEDENSDRMIDTDDIRKDAERVKIRRLLYDKLNNMTAARV